jgi:CRP/FNR family transcriptional regulator, cyclic AMP receptor protein
MIRDHLIAALRGTEVFAGAHDATLGRIAERMRERRFDPGQLLFARGDAGDRLYFIVSGRLRLSVVTEEGRELAFRQASTGDVIGEIALLDGGARTADATALDAVVTMSLDRAEALDLVKADPGFASTVIAFLCRRLRDTSQQLENIALFPIEIRLARFFLLLVQAKGEGSGAKVLVEPRMSQSELALLIGASRPKVNLGIGQLEEMGAVKREGDGFLCSRSRLRAIAGIED